MTAEVQRRKSTGDFNIFRRTNAPKNLNENVAIADLNFAYNNSALIHALRQRGGFIALQKFDKVQEKDEEINELFKDFESLTRPTACFITFEEEDAASMALTLDSNDTLLNTPMKFKRASEPTDIIWENRIFT